MIDACLHALHDELDHRYLNEDVAGLANSPITTESLGDYIFRRASSMTPLDRVRLHERADFFAEVWKNRAVFLGMRMAFYAAHRLCAADSFRMPKTQSSTASATIRWGMAMVI